jgi:hypothetical protein
MPHEIFLTVFFSKPLPLVRYSFPMLSDSSIRRLGRQRTLSQHCRNQHAGLNGPMSAARLALCGRHRFPIGLSFFEHPETGFREVRQPTLVESLSLGILYACPGVVLVNVQCNVFHNGSPPQSAVILLTAVTLSIAFIVISMTPEELSYCDTVSCRRRLSQFAGIRQTHRNRLSQEKNCTLRNKMIMHQHVQILRVLCRLFQKIF